MNKCKNYKKQIILMFYNELDRSERTELLAHLQVCPDCKQAFEQLEQLGEFLQEHSLFKVDENGIKRMNNLIRLKIEKQSNKKFVPFTFIHPKPAFQYGFVVLLIMFGFLLGRQNYINRNPIQTQNQLQQLLTAGGSVKAPNGNINPYLIGVERLKFNPQDGTIDIQYNTVNDILLKGTPETPVIKDLLLYAMAGEKNPNVRLHAVRAVNDAAQSNLPLDVDYIQSLEQILLEEENPGIKLLALNVLKTLPLRENIKNILVRVLLYDPDAPVRIQAFKTLTEAQITKTDIEEYLQPSVNDSNRYISYKSEKLIEQFKDQKTGPFELSRKEK